MHEDTAKILRGCRAGILLPGLLFDFGGEFTIVLLTEIYYNITHVHIGWNNRPSMPRLVTMEFGFHKQEPVQIMPECTALAFCICSNR